MEEKMDNGRKPREFRGLYKHVKISVKTLDIIIASCIAVIILVLIVNLKNPGFTVTFDSRGGTDVSPQKQMYGELLVVPEDPEREGYTFTGWYTDPACDVEWETGRNTIKGEMTLYAGWNKRNNE